MSRTGTPQVNLPPRPRAGGRGLVDEPAAPLLVEVVRGIAVGVLALVCGLMVWTLLPCLAGLKPQVVLTGSMAPRIAPGDLVLAAPVDARTVRKGQVVLFEDPAHPGRSVVHRVVGRDLDGRFITRGDANAVEDSTPVPPSAVRGLPRLRVPFVGLPLVWLREGRFLPLGLLGLAGCLTAAVLTPVASPRPAPTWLNATRSTGTSP